MNAEAAETKIAPEWQYDSSLGWCADWGSRVHIVFEEGTQAQWLHEVLRARTAVGGPCEHLANT
jgi:hypothetical protein